MFRIFIFLTLTSCICAKGQVYYVNEPFLKAYSHVVNFEKNKALDIIQEQTKGKKSVNLLFYYLESSTYFIEAFLTENKEDKNKWDQKFSFWETKFLNGKKSSPYYRYCIAHLYLQKGLLNLKFQEYVQAGLDLRKATRMLEKNYQLFPDFVVQYKEFGLLQCFLGNIPEQYEWLLGLAGLSGDLKQGESLLLKILKLSMENEQYSFLQIETLLYYSTVITILHNDAEIVKKVFPFFSKVDPLFHKSPLYIYMLSNVYSHMGNNDKALEELKNYKPLSTSIRFDYLTYLKGVLMLHQAKPQARQHFFKFISDFEGMHYVKSAYHKIAWTYLLEGDLKQYELYMSIASNSGLSVNDADKQAMHELKSKNIPNPDLLRARLLCDGGYYNQALIEMQSIDSSEICQKKKFCTEYHYRHARIYHLSNNLTLAIDAYKTVIEMGQNDKEYFAANAALMLGMIYEEKIDFSTARHYYKLCLNMPFEEYRNSIQQKAKAGLQRVGR